MGELCVKKLENDANAAQKELAHMGEEIYQMLELWQMAGATFEALCSLCNRDPAQVRRELGPKELDASLVYKLVKGYAAGPGHAARPSPLSGNWAYGPAGYCHRRI